MAYKQSLDTINRWLVKYGEKRKLYAKDVISDLIWIYLINANFKDTASDINYYDEYDDCKSKIEDIYNGTWEIRDVDDSDTVVLENNLKKINYDLEHAKLVSFIKENTEAFKTAYAKPRRHLKNYVNHILSALNKNKMNKRAWTLNSLRGYLDDSMINYLSGSDEAVNIVDAPCGGKAVEMKYIPKTKRSHILLCLALGMVTEEINEYLEMMGYFALDGTNSEEGQLINILSKWDKEHELQRKYKDKYFKDKTKVYLSTADEIKAAEEMLATGTKKTQNIVCSSRFDKIWGCAPFNLGATAQTQLFYESSDPDVAAVTSDGTVTIKGCGSAEITITAIRTADYKAATKKITITVAKAKQTIAGSKTFAKTFAYNTFYLGASAKTHLTYKSSNTNIAIVASAGKVTLKNPGKAYITVKAQPSQFYNAASAKVTVASSLKKPTLAVKAYSGRNNKLSWNKVIRYVCMTAKKRNIFVVSLKVRASSQWYTEDLRQVRHTNIKSGHTE